MRASCLLGVMVVVGLVGASVTSAAPTWTPVASGTTGTITAMAYLTDGTLVYATVGGQVLRRTPGGSPELRVAAPGVVFDDIAARGSLVLAVGSGGSIYRSADAGATWVRIPSPTSNADDCTGSVPLGDLHQVAFASAQVAYAFGARNQVVRSANGGGSWANWNRGPAGCRVDLPADVTGSFFSDGSPSVGYLQSRTFGELAAVTDDLTTATRRDSGLNGFRGVHRLAGDPARPNRQWGIAADAAEPGESFVTRTDDAWMSSTGWNIDAVGGRTLVPPEDVAFAGGTVLAAGRGGELLTSRDGTTFVLHDAGGTLAAQPWRSVALVDGARGAVGGAGGALAVTGNAAAPADGTAPTGRIDGPAAATAGDPVTFTARVADEAGGSGVDPASLAWSAPGQPARTGPTVTYAFAAAGSVRIAVAFRDRRGNAGQAVRDVVVAPRPTATTPTTPTATTPAPTTPVPTPPSAPGSPVTVVTTVVAPAPVPAGPTTRTVRRRGAGGTLALTVPTACIVPGAAVRARLALQRPTPGSRVRTVSFTTQGAGTELIDRRSPFAARVTLRGRRGAARRLTARVTLRLRGGRRSVRSVSAPVRLCP